MNRALIHKATNRFCQVELPGKEFPVHSDLEWHNCPVDVRPETHDFNGTTFVVRPVIPTPAEAPRMMALAAINDEERASLRTMRELLLALAAGTPAATALRAIDDRIITERRRL